METALRVLAGLILVVFVIGPISIAIGALVIHLWRRLRNAGSNRGKNSR